jgi:hypothetical protein
MKSFRDQIIAVMKQRNTGEVRTKDVDECSTSAAQTLMTYIRQWNFASRNTALGRLLECDRWTKEGTLSLETNWKTGKPYPCKLSLDIGYQRYRYGDQTAQWFPNMAANRIKLIPDNVTEDWAAELKEMFADINRMPLNDFKLISLGKAVKSIGGSNPHAIAQWEREVSEFKAVQAAIDAFVVTRKGWEYLTTANMQNPKHGQEMSKVLCDILAKADAAKEPAFKALKEQHRRDNIRRDATYARNNVKELKGFFQKYATLEPAAISLLSGIIDDVESHTLNPQGKENKT